MKKEVLITLVLSGSWCKPATAQQFQHRYDAVGQFLPESGFGIEKLTDGSYLLVSGARYHDDLDTAIWVYSSVVTSMKVDQSGSILDTTKVLYQWKATYPGVANSLFATTNGLFGVGGSSFASDGTQLPALFVFDQSGDTVLVKDFNQPGQSWIGRQGKATPDGGYVICGETSASGTSLDAFLLKLDSTGTQEWIETYGNDSTLVREFAWSVAIAPDGGYYVGGLKDEALWVADHWLAKISPGGVFQWEQTFGSPAFDENYTANIEAMSNGDVVYVSSWAQDAPGDFYRLGMSRLDSTGNLLWSQQYDGTVFGSSLSAVKEITPNGDLIAAGHSYPNGYIQGCMLRTNSLGDSLWMRYYHYTDSLWTEGKGAFRDVIPTNDGGFIAVGAAYGSNNPNDTAIYSQDTWVVKVDSMGCLVPGCHIVTSIESLNTNYQDIITVFPNPVRSNGTVSLSLDLPGPASRSSNANLRLTVVNSTGQVVHEQVIPPIDRSPITISAPREAGVYYLHLASEERWISGAKLVVD